MAHDFDPTQKLAFSKKFPNKTIEEMPSWYLRWLLEQPWIEKYKQYIPHIEGELKWRQERGIDPEDEEERVRVW